MKVWSAALCLLFATAAVDAATFTVTNAADSGAGSLRQAVVDAMATPEADTIEFGVNATIILETQLPDLDAGGGALTIDGTGHTVIINGNAHRVVLVDSGGALKLVNLTIANGASGALYNRGALTVTRCTFLNNVDGTNGAAIFNISPDPVTIVSSTFTGNSAESSGGAIYNEAGTMTIVNSTIVGNSAGEGGGGVAVDEGGTTLTLINTIVAGNTGGNCGGSGTVTNGGNNIDSGTTCGWGFADGSMSGTNPKLGALAFNAPGTTQTFAPLAGSPALDAGRNAGCAATDQRGIGRPQGATCDIGAFEAVVLPAPPNYQGLWWVAAGAEAGWGINFSHQGDIIFATWFTYDADGRPWWLIAELHKTAAGVYAGQVSTVTGPPFNSVPFPAEGTPGGAVESVVGTMAVTFADTGHAMIDYAVNGITQSKAIVPFEFGTRPVCTWGLQPGLGLATNYQDLWWTAPGGSESGWGINFSHQGNIIFATWFTYDADGKPWWLIAELHRNAAGAYAGAVSTLTGPPFDSEPFPGEGKPGGAIETVVGSAIVTFADGNHATFDYTIGAVIQSKAITRIVYVAPGTVCN